MSPRASPGPRRTTLAALRAHHETHPHAGGMPREEARERLFRRRRAGGLRGGPRQGWSSAPARRARPARARGHGSLALRAETRAQAALEQVYRDAGLTPPDLDGRGRGRHGACPVAERMIQLLVRAADAGEAGYAAVSRRRARAAQGRRAADEGRTAADARVDVAAFKARYGITRKYRDSVAGIPGPGAGDAADGREPDRAVASENLTGMAGERTTGRRGRPSWLP